METGKGRKEDSKKRTKGKGTKKRERDPNSELDRTSQVYGDISLAQLPFQLGGNKGRL